MKIFKYILEITDTQKIKLPLGAYFLSVQIQNGRIYVWARVSENAPQKEYYFRIYGTGHPCNDSIELMYLGTVQQDNFVWHIFVKI